MKNVWQYLNSQPYQHAAPDDGSAPDGSAGDPPTDAASDDGSPGDPPADDAPSTDDWRARVNGFADEGEDFTKLTERFASEADFVKGAVQAHQKLRAGEVKPIDVSEMSDEQLAEYRSQIGVPADGKYNIQLEEGLALPETEDGMVQKFLEVSHLANVPEATVNAQLSVYASMVNQVMENMSAQDGLDEQSFKEIAKENWGKDYEVNMNRITNQFNLMPESIREGVMAARMPDGRALTNSPEFMNYLATLDRQINPMDPLPGGGDQGFTGAQQIIEESKARMRDDPKGWYADKSAQERFMQAQSWMDKYNQQSK